MPKKQFEYILTQHHRDGTLLDMQSGTIDAYTLKSAKHILVKRFGLQNWSPWRQTESGKQIRTQWTAFLGKITIGEIHDHNKTHRR